MNYRPKIRSCNALNLRSQILNCILSTYDHKNCHNPCCQLQMITTFTFRLCFYLSMVTSVGPVARTIVPLLKIFHFLRGHWASTKDSSVDMKKCLFLRVFFNFAANAFGPSAPKQKYDTKYNVKELCVGSLFSFGIHLFQGSTSNLL